MAADPVDPASRLACNAPLTRPRPGHADLAGMQKYGHTDARPSGTGQRRETALVAVGTVASAAAPGLGVVIVSHVVELGTVAVRRVPPRTGRHGPARRGSVAA
jgi:chorismate synthase